MFDNKEALQRALRHAGMIVAEKREKRKRLSITFLICGTFSIAVLTLAVFAPNGTNATTYYGIDSNQIPLVAGNLREDATTEETSESVFRDNVFYAPNISRVQFISQTQHADVVLLNPDSNELPVTFEIVLFETGETLFLSDSVEPGMFIEKPTISSSLESGEHRATLIIRTYEHDDEIPAATVSVEFIIVS